MKKSPSTEGAAFDSPPGHNRCNPGYRRRPFALALNGRHSVCAPDGFRIDSARCAVECRPVGANRFIGSDNPGLRCAAPWAIECDPLGVEIQHALRVEFWWDVAILSQAVTELGDYMNSAQPASKLPAIESHSLWDDRQKRSSLWRTCRGKIRHAARDESRRSSHSYRKRRSREVMP